MAEQPSSKDLTTMLRSGRASLMLDAAEAAADEIERLTLGISSMMSDPVKCHKCAGNGWIPVQVCCGNPVVGAEYIGAQEMICCGDPEEDTETCPICNGNGEARATPGDGSSHE